MAFWSTHPAHGILARLSTRPGTRFSRERHEDQNLDRAEQPVREEEIVSASRSLRSPLRGRFSACVAISR